VKRKREGKNREKKRGKRIEGTEEKEKTKKKKKKKTEERESKNRKKRETEGRKKRRPKHRKRKEELKTGGKPNGECHGKTLKKTEHRCRYLEPPSVSPGAATSLRQSTASNDSATTSSAPGNPSSSPILAFRYFLLCMQNE
jgi:hypothetical protein